MITGSIIILLLPDYGYQLVLAFISLSFEFTGIGRILYYISMGRHMVGGKTILYRGAIRFNFGLFTGSLISIPQIYVILYLLALHSFSGIVEILRAFESKSYGAKSWKLKFMHGLIDFCLVIFCLIFIKEPSTAAIIYSAGLIYSAFMRIISAFKPSAIVYIQ